jgi:hypothetical protein
MKHSYAQSGWVNQSLMKAVSRLRLIKVYSLVTSLSSFLQVVYNLDVATAGYVGNTFNVVAFVFLFLAGWLIRVTCRFKWILWVCIPLYIFGLGLMIHFRTPGGYIGYIVMCEIFLSIPGSIFILCVQVAVLASVDHQHVAAALALLFVMGSIGGSIGSAICGAIWTNTFLKKLQETLPEDAMPNVLLIYKVSRSNSATLLEAPLEMRSWRLTAMRSPRCLLPVPHSWFWDSFGLA